MAVSVVSDTTTLRLVQFPSLSAQVLAKTPWYPVHSLISAELSLRESVRIRS